MGSGGQAPDASQTYGQVEGAAIVAADVADPYVLLRFDDDSAAVLLADSTTGLMCLSVCHAQADSVAHGSSAFCSHPCARAEHAAFTA